MNPFDKIRGKRIFWGIVSGILAVLLGIVCVMTAVRLGEQPKQYYVPEHDKNALPGMPGKENLEEIIPKDGMRIGFSVPARYREDKLYIDLTNYGENEVYLSVFLYDENKQIIADSGMIYEGEYLPYLELGEKLDVNREYLLKVVAYHREKMTSEGSAWIRIRTTEE